jgi:hypothetical protein
MKQNLKFLLFIVILFTITFYYSCSKDKIEKSNENKIELETAPQKQLKIDFSKFDQAVDKSYNLLSDEIKLKNQTLFIQTSTIDWMNLNEVFSIIDNSMKVLAITILEDEQNIKDGIIIHYTDKKGNLRLESYKKLNDYGLFELVDFPVNLVTHFTMNNLLFIARSNFPNRNLYTIGVSKLGYFISKNKQDDISMIRFAIKNNLLKSDKYKEIIQNNIIGSSHLRMPNDEACAIAVHQCNNGSETRTECHPFAGGCKEPVIDPEDDCPEEGTKAALLDAGMQNEYNEFISNLISSELYEFSDSLESTPRGIVYVSAYYALSHYFIESLDVSLLYDIVSASDEMAEFVDAMLNDDLNYTLSESVFNMFVEILENSAENSSNEDYEEIVENIIDEMQMYKSKNIQQIKSLLLTQ